MALATSEQIGEKNCRFSREALKKLQLHARELKQFKQGSDKYFQEWAPLQLK